VVILEKNISRGFINIFRRRATGFHRQAKLFELTFFIRKTSSRWSNQVGKINLPCAWPLNETLAKAAAVFPFHTLYKAYIVRMELKAKWHFGLIAQGC